MSIVYIDVGELTSEHRDDELTVTRADPTIEVTARQLAWWRSAARERMDCGGRHPGMEGYRGAFAEFDRPPGSELLDDLGALLTLRFSNRTIVYRVDEAANRFDADEQRALGPLFLLEWPD